jgi:CHAT domain-containing protein/tetratricopeptide (TPR) repeat protein
MARVTIAEALNEVLGTWERQSPPAEPGPAMTAERAMAVLDKVEQITDHRPVALDAAWQGVPSAAAAAAVAELERRLRWSRDDALERAVEARQAGRGDQANDSAEAAAELSKGLFEDRYFGMALNLLGQAARARGDTVAGLNWYRAAEDLAVAHNLPGVLSGALDNIGNCLASMGRLDEAVKAFARAAEVAGTPEVAVIVARNWAHALASAGRIRLASALLQNAADENLTGLSLPALHRALLLDDLAELALNLGDPDRAETLLRKARPVFDGLDNRLERGHHASGWVLLAQQRGDRRAETAAFIEGHDLILEHWRSEADADRYIRAYAATFLASAAARGPALGARLQPGLDALNSGRPTEAVALLEPVFRDADAAGDKYFSGRAAVHVGIALRESGRIDAAHEWLRRATALARLAGDARVEAQALWNLTLLADASGEVADDLTGLSTLLHVLALEELLPSIALNMDPISRENYLGGLGSTQNQLGRLAVSHGAEDLARAYFAEALWLAPSGERRPALVFARANRLASKVIAMPHDTTPAELDELEHLATMYEGDRRVVQNTRNALGRYHLQGGRLAEAAEQLRASCAPGEAVRQTLTAQQRAAAAGAASTGPWGPLAACYARLGQADDAIQASQAAKGRHIVDVLDARTDDPHDGAPLTVREIRQRLADIFGDVATCLVDLTVFGTMITLIVVSADRAEVRLLPLPDDERWHRKVAAAAALEGPPGLVRLVAEDSVLAALAAELERLIPAGASILGCLDSVLQQLPLHALAVGGGPWYERNAWSLLPATGLLRHISGEPAPRHGHSFVGGDSRADLPAARRECQAVARAVGVAPALGADCSVSALHETLARGPLDVLHLAVHGLGDRRRGRYSGLIMADAQQGAVLVPFERLTEVGLRADLVVLSGCSTAVAGPLHRSQMAGVSVAAIESGARSVVGCLWPVDDIAAEVFMGAFYQKLVQTWDEAPVDLRTCMDAGRLAVRTWAQSSAAPAGYARDGSRDMAIEDAAALGQGELTPAAAAALAWAPFTLIGDPVLFG